DEIVHYTAGFHTRRPADGQRQARPGIVASGLAPRERKPVVAGDHHERVVELTGVFEQLQHCADVAVETLDLEVVVKDVAAHGRCVRQERRHGYVFDAMSGLHTSAAFVRPVRILTAEPETERLAGRHALEK